MAYRLAIFDVDGTLLDSYPWFARTINDVADAHGFKRVEGGDFELLRGMGAREIMRHLGVTAWKMPLIANDMRRRKTVALASIRLFDGVDAMLRTLAQRGIALAIVSSDNEANVRTSLGPELGKLVSQFACGAAIFGKARKFEAVVRRAGVSHAEAICIGDEIRDIEAARKAGLTFGAVAWGYTRPEALAARKPDLMFREVGDIVAMLGSARPRSAEAL